MAHDVFISYASLDKPIADAVCATLEARSIRCWIAPRDIMYGADWGEAIVDALGGSRVMVLVFSSNANESPNIKREVDRAVTKGVTIIPLRIEDVAPSRALEYYISPIHWLDSSSRRIETDSPDVLQAQIVDFLNRQRLYDLRVEVDRDLNAHMTGTLADYRRGDGALSALSRARGLRSSTYEIVVAGGGDRP